ncbi:MAG: TonB-dependent receptor [Ignavibacteriales bacterium]|nr:TonB-dependent receptor [Ignavibacteriales bacterium]
MVRSNSLREGARDGYHGSAILSATQFGLSAEGPLLTKGSFLLSVRRSYLEPLFEAYKLAYVPYFYDGLAKVSYDLSATHNFSFVFLGAVDRMKYHNDTYTNLRNNSIMMFTNQNKFVSGASWRYASGILYSKFSISRSYQDFEYFQFDIFEKPKFNSMSYEKELSFREDVALTLTPSTELSFGAEARRIALSGHLVTNVLFAEYKGPAIKIDIDQRFDSSVSKYAAYAQLLQSWGRFSIAVGLRFDRFTMLNTERNVVGPRSSMTYMITPVTKLTVSAGRYYQSPAYIWLMTNPYSRDSLTYLRADHYIAGIEHNVQDDLKASVEVYEKRYSQYPLSLLRSYLVMSNTGSSSLGDWGEAYASFGVDFLKSAATGYSRGVEFFLQKTGTPWYGSLGITISQTRFTAADSVSRPSSNDQFFVGHVGGGYVFESNWETSANFYYSTGKPYTPFGINHWDKAKELYNASRIGDNHRLDVRVSKTYEFSSTTLVAYVDIQNVYNRKPLESPVTDYGVNPPVLTTRSEIGIVPSIGVRYEF